MHSLSVKFVKAYLGKVFFGMFVNVFLFLPRRDDQIHDHSVQLVLGDLIGVDVVGRVDRLRLDSVRCLPGLEVHNEDQRLCVVAMPSYTLEHFNY